MKYFFITGSIVITLLILIYKPSASYDLNKKAYEGVIRMKSFSSIRCGVDWSAYHLTESEVQQMVPLPGLGFHAWKISTSSDSAQFYFNQAINLYYGFHIIEALPSFKKAQTFDPGCAMLLWGEALAYGPNINDYHYVASAEAFQAVLKAKALKGATMKEQLLIKAMALRYSSDSSKKREYLNQLYADAMKTLYSSYPKDPEVGSLYVDALMNQHPWNWWELDGTPKPWTPNIKRTLENILHYSPDHPGANHYYIHIMEASPYPSKAIISANKLGRLTPGLSHMVHMPSHIYIRTGQYSKGIKVNNEAVKLYKKYLTLFPNVMNNASLYEIHNRHMQANCSLNLNEYAGSLSDALICRNSFDTSLMSFPAPEGNYYQYIYMTPVISMLTFNKFSEIIEQPDLGSNWHYGSLIMEFARGVAYANLNNLSKAKECLDKVHLLLTEKDLTVVMEPFNAPIVSARIAENILKGSIEENKNNLTRAINYYKIAVLTEDSLIYDEPRDWLVPSRHYLGNALLKIKNYKEAKKIFLQDLEFQPKNYISEKGLANCKK